jgi:hypothetical protein
VGLSLVNSHAENSGRLCLASFAVDLAGFRQCVGFVGLIVTGVNEYEMGIADTFCTCSFDAERDSRRLIFAPVPLITYQFHVDFRIETILAYGGQWGL